MIRGEYISLILKSMLFSVGFLLSSLLSGQHYRSHVDSVNRLEDIDLKISYLDEQIGSESFINSPDTIALLCLFKSEILFRNNVSIERAIAALDEGLTFVNQFDYPEIWLDLWYYKGYWYRKWDKYKEAKRAINKVLAHPEEHHLAWDATIQLGKIYKDRGDFTLALKTYDEAILMAGEDIDKLASTYEVISFVYLIMESVEGAENAIPWLRKLINLIQGMPGEEHFTAIMTYNLATAYMTLEDYTEAELYLNSAESAINACCDDDDFRSLVLESRGSILAEQGRYNEALLSYEKALSLYDESFDLTRSDGLASTYHQIASIYHNMGDLENALAYIDRTLGYRLAGIDAGISCAEISIERLRSNGEKHYLIDELITKAEIIIDESIKLNTVQLLDHALMTLEHCDLVVDHMRKEQIDDNSKLFWRNKTKEVYDLLIYVNFELGDFTKAFHFSEKSKYLLLGEHLAQIHPSMLEEVAVSSSLLEEYITLEKEIDGVTLLLNRLNKKEDQVSADSLLGHINSLLKTKDDAITRLQENYPEFYAANFTLPIASIADVRTNMISGDEHLVEFHLSDSVLYSFVITQDTVALVRVEGVRELPSMLQELREVTIDKNRHSVALLKRYAELGYAVYENLFDPIAHLIGKHLIVINDPMLSTFPLSILLSEEVNNEAYFDIREWPFLINSKMIQHFYSASLALQVSNGAVLGSKYKSVLGCRPSFGEDLAYQNNNEDDNLREGLRSLYGTKVELDYLKNSIKGDYLENDLVSKSNLIDHLSRPYSIIHIASHAVLDDQDSKFSKLVLNDQQDDEGALYSYEIERAEIKSDLVVLSACNTGFGKLEKGEGMNSLGLAFAKAGSPNLLTSLWAVSDKATAVLMTNFYNSLLNRSSIAKSIRDAQLKFLDSQPAAYHHPYYWGGFVYYGNGVEVNIEEVSIASPISKGWGAWCVVLMMLPLYWGVRRSFKLFF